MPNAGGAPQRRNSVRSVGATMTFVGALTFVIGLIALDARATYGARVTADEPQYLTTALSLAEDFDLDISDEIADERYLPYHEIPLNTQTMDLDESGQRLSPHDPLLPVILAAPMGLGGWQLAKATLALVAALTAAITAGSLMTRFRVSATTTAIVVGGFFVSPPMAAYATQVYPEMPAAMCVVTAFWALTGPPTATNRWIAIASIVALPWLAVKYAPVAAVLAVALFHSLRKSQPAASLPPGKRSRPASLLTIAVLTLSAVIYLVIHRRVYGGWTVYAAGDHFVDNEFSVIGENANYIGRSRRLIGLLVDRTFGLIAWNPAFILAVPALAWTVRRRGPGWSLIVATVLTGWATATWVALTMHGWWWPGRQVVVILPLVIIAIATYADRSAPRLAAAAGGCTVAVFGWFWLVVEASTDRRTLVVDFDETANPWYQLWRTLLPDHRRMNSLDIWLTIAWALLLGALTVLAWRQASRSDPPTAADSIASDMAPVEVQHG